MIKDYDAQVFNTIYKLSKTTSIDNLTTKLISKESGISEVSFLSTL